MTIKEIGKIADNNALAWNEHKCYGKSGSSFLSIIMNSERI